MNTRLMWVTPDMAGQWLAKNTGNRKLRAGGVAVYAAEIRAGRWHVVHTGIAFDTTGKLVDGQHRLFAIMETGISIPMCVTFGVPVGSMDAVDRGLSRSIPDILRLGHGLENSARIAALVNVIAPLVEGYDLKMTPGVAMDVWRQWKPNLEWALQLPATGTLWKAPIVAAFVVARRTDRDMVDSFVDRYRDGVDLFEGMAAHYIRRQFLEAKRDAKFRNGPKLSRWVLAVLLRHVSGARVRAISDDDQSGYEYFVTQYDERLALAADEEAETPAPTSATFGTVFAPPLKPQGGGAS